MGPQSSNDAAPLHVVGIGASAGGLEAIEAFFDHVPPGTGLAFVLIQHLSPDYKSLMDELLARHTTMPIVRVEGSTPLRPNTVFLIPPKRNLIMSRGALELVDQDHSGGANLPIDLFFRSLAGEVAERAIAVVLSGTGSDGSRGLQAVHDAGGVVLVQSPESAAFDGMPRNAIATRKVDVVDTPDRLPERILEYLEAPHAFVRDVDRDRYGPARTYIEQIFRLFRQSYSIDFSMYKPGTIERRLERRVMLTRASDLAAYAARLEEDPVELAALYRDLLVEVTQFFRDPAAFERLAKDVLPPLLASPRTDQLRLWVPGCATGEEAYSLAIRIHDLLERGKGEASVKIFATDVHRESLEIAGAGVYSAESVARVPEAERRRYFVRHGNLYHVSADIRRMVVFAAHDLTRDPPFTRVDLISCRNLLIYFKPEVQQRILSLFHFALRVGGCLLLGPSESVRPFDSEFECLDLRWKIFRKLRDVRLTVPTNIAQTNTPLEPIPTRPPPLTILPRRSGLPPVSSVFHLILARHLNPSILLNPNGELMHTFGPVGRYLTHPEGPATTELVKMLTGELRIAVSTGLHRVALTREALTFNRVRFREGDTELLIRVTIEPYLESDERYTLVTFTPLDTPFLPAGEQATDAQIHVGHHLQEMERELDVMRESLQATVEELSASNEELQATNEELVASNEELQSTNEELQSVNEELHTVNTEHQRKIDELVELNSDLDSLLKATHVAILYLDGGLRIRRFTDGITAAFNLLPQDVGRPIEHISHNLSNTHVMSLLRECLETGSHMEVTAHTTTGQSVVMRIMSQPAANEQRRGLLVTVANSDSLERMRDETRRMEAQLQRSDQQLVDFAYSVSHDLQAGLRHLNEGVRNLKESLSTVIEVDTRRSLTLIHNSAAELTDMVEGLLTYSRVHTRRQPYTSVDLNHTLDAVLRRLSLPIAEVGAEISRDPLPTVVADAGQMETLLFHLVDNALKYRAKRPLRVQIGGTEREGLARITVADNGEGIDPRNLSRIFVIFQRLHLRSEVPGLGIGLPLARRIAEMHHGKIEVASELGKGSIFTVELPIRPTDETPLPVSPLSPGPFKG